MEDDGNIFIGMFWGIILSAVMVGLIWFITSDFLWDQIGKFFIR